MVNLSYHAFELLDSAAHNIAQTQHFLSMETGMFRLPFWVVPAGYQCHVSATGDEIRLISQETRRTVYAVKLTPRHRIIEAFPLLNQGNKQYVEVLVWRSKECGYESAIADLTHRFFDYFLGLYHVVIPVEQITPAFNTFWLRRVSRALWFGQHVYLSGEVEGGLGLIKVMDYEMFYLRWSRMIKKNTLQHDPTCLVVICSTPLVVQRS